MNPLSRASLSLHVLDELTLTVVVDNTTDSLSSIGPGVPQVLELIFLFSSISPSREHDGHDCITVFDQMCVACHGLSVLVTGRCGGEIPTALFDVGPNGDVWVDDARRLGIDFATIDTLFLSHWHWDHSGGIPTVVDAITKVRRSLGKKPLVGDLHPDRPDQRGILLPGGPMVMLPEQPTIAAIEDAGGEVVTHADAHLFGDGFFLATAVISRGRLPTKRDCLAITASTAIRGWTTP